MNDAKINILAGLLVFTCVSSGWSVEPADLILTGGQVVTVDDDLTIAQAIAVRDGRIVKVGSVDEVAKFNGEQTTVVPLEGRTVIPGLIDSHVHPNGAAMHEFDHEISDMETIQDVLDYIAGLTKIREEDQWIWVSQIFITRLREQRFPTRAELDRVAPNHPVVFRTGPDAALNSKALKLSGIDEDFKIVGPGHLERDPQTGKLNGILRACTRYIKSGDTGGKKATEADRQNRLAALFHDYNSVGITAVADRAADASSLNRYNELLEQDRLTVRVSASWHIGTGGSIKDSSVNKLPDLWFSVRRYLVVPVAVKCGSFDFDGIQFLIRNFATLFVFCFIKPTVNFESFIGSRGTDEVHDDFVTLQWNATPVPGDVTE